MSLLLIVSLFLSGIIISADSLYVEESGSPYDAGSLTGTEETILLTPQQHGIPMQTSVSYPAVDDEFAVAFMLSGLGGLVPPFIYRDWISQIAAHGFVTLQPIPLNGGFQFRETLQWLQENFGDYISSNITLAWDHVGFLCHSSGCEEFLTLFETFDDPTFAKTLFMLEPFATVPNEINYEIPAAFYGTNASCNVPGADYIAVFDQWQFAKIRTGNNLYGHCDFLDQYMVPTCRFVCPGGAPLDQLPEYRQQMQGMTSALFIHILQGRADVIDYLLDPELFLIPPTDHDVSQW